MSIVMKIGPKDSVAERAKQALWEVCRNGQLPQKWTLGREVWNRMNREYDQSTMIQILVGVPFCLKLSAPPDLLELDAF